MKLEIITAISGLIIALTGFGKMLYEWFRPKRKEKDV